MVDRNPQMKQDEQYPLLKVNGGEGDGAGHTQNSSNVISTGWRVSCIPKKSWFSRWPEFFSACWMTMILLGVSFIVFYALGMTAYRRQPIIVIKCNNSKPASNVYYHQIVQRSAHVPFILYSEYLANMATQYPFLTFNVIFLMDDSLQTAIRAPRHSRYFMNKLIPYHPTIDHNTMLEENNKRELIDFQMKYQNVNITVIPLSKFMSMTPLRYRWRTIPLSYLPFYARIFSVWQNGGVGIDLTTFNNRFNNNQDMDRNIVAILRQHNNGIKPENYANTLNTIDRDQENEFVALFYGLVNQLLNETRSLFNKTISFSSFTTEKALRTDKPLVRVHRDKRELYEVVNNTDSGKIRRNSTVSVQFINAKGEKADDDNLTKIEYQTSPDSTKDLEFLTNTEIMKPIIFNITNSTEIETVHQKKLATPKSKIKSGAYVTNHSDTPQVVLFYDFSIFTDGIGPSYLLPETLVRSDFVNNMPKEHDGFTSSKRSKLSPHLLSIDSEGMFIAASSRLHPFLGHLISAGCQRMHPKFAIQDALLTQCSGIFRDDVYCSSIFVL